MTINVYEDGGVVVVDYITEAGSASATVVDESIESVKNRAEEIVNIHDLDVKADQS